VSLLIGCRPPMNSVPSPGGETRAPHRGIQSDSDRPRAREAALSQRLVLELCSGRSLPYWAG
jgi:hypothetical protein